MTRMQNSVRIIRRWVKLSKSAQKSDNINDQNYPIEYVVLGNGKPIGHVIRALIKKPDFLYLVDIRITELHDFIKISHGLVFYEYRITDIKAILVNIPVWWKQMKRKYKLNKLLQAQTNKLRKQGKIGRTYREQW